LALKINENYQKNVSAAEKQVNKAKINEKFLKYLYKNIKGKLSRNSYIVYNGQ